jgi:hypothetical protein
MNRMNLKHIFTFLVSIILCSVCVVSSAKSRSVNRPNVASVISDDHSWFDHFVCGNFKTQTPADDDIFSSFKENDRSAETIGLADNDTIPVEVVFETGFETLDEQEAWVNGNFGEGYESSTALSFNLPDGQTNTSHLSNISIDLSKYAGCRLQFECMAKAQNVSETGSITFSLNYKSGMLLRPNMWVGVDNESGTFDWKKLKFSARIPPDASLGKIFLGLNKSSGMVVFDDVKVSVLSGPIVRPEPPANPPEAFKGHNLPRLRGVMVGNVSEEDLRVLGSEWKANVVRSKIRRNYGEVGSDRDLAEYDNWLNDQLEELDNKLEICRRYGLKLVVDMATPPGGQ